MVVGRGLAGQEVQPLDLWKSEAGFLSDIFDLSTENKHLKRVDVP